jgi:hypothetical protein
VRTFSTGQRVEVLDTVFTRQANGTILCSPDTWCTGTVDRIETMSGGLTQVFVRRDIRGWSPQIIGKRGGSRRIRAYVEMPSKLTVTCSLCAPMVRTEC